MSAPGTRPYAPLLLAAVATLVSMALPAPFSFLLSSGGFSLLILLQIKLLAGEGSTHTTNLLFRLLGWLSLASLWLWLLTPAEVRSSGLPLLVMLSLFELQAFIRLIGRLSHERRVTREVLMGALAGYVLLGLTAALLTALVESIHPGSFSGLPESISERVTVHNQPGTMQDARFIHLTYFAFVTMTTLGYGDVVPLTPQAKLLSICLSVLGTFYLAVNLGVLIGRFIQEEQAGP
ncbi:MAG: hypothetical protein ER33_00835 [Cyanobium sp. CACIAM 14]|nr:MAG: hypothetical protein ER33_00835 [Cyanobium sp. CACIAM 14]